MNYFNILDISNWDISSQRIADIIFMLTVGMSAIFTIIFYYHWRKYGMGGARIHTMEIVYIVGLILLIAISFITLK